MLAIRGEQPPCDCRRVRPAETVRAVAMAATRTVTYVKGTHWYDLLQIAMSDEVESSAVPAPLSGGHLLSAISTGIVKLMREHYGRGPIKAKTYALDDIIVCVLRGSGF